MWVTHSASTSKKSNFHIFSRKLSLHTQLTPMQSQKNLETWLFKHMSTILVKETFSLPWREMNMKALTIIKLNIMLEVILYLKPCNWKHLRSQCTGIFYRVYGPGLRQFSDEQLHSDTAKKCRGSHIPIPFRYSP